MPDNIPIPIAAAFLAGIGLITLAMWASGRIAAHEDRPTREALTIAEIEDALHADEALAAEWDAHLAPVTACRADFEGDR